MTERASPVPPFFLFVHGAWHGAAHWDRVRAVLAAAGCRSAAIDLPGSGPAAALPRAYETQDLDELVREPSPLAHVTLEDQAAAIVAEIERQQAAHGPVVVVAHSAGGLPATSAVERVPDRVSRIVYVAAHCPVALATLSGYLGLPESAAAQLGPLFLGEPGVLGAVRINPRAADPGYQEALRQGFYSDLGAAEARPFIARLTPDLPLRVATDEVRVSAQRWGRVRRTYVRTLADRALPLALQDRLIAEADALTPHNRFEVHSLDCGHSPFASCPGALAALLHPLP
ncbi:alpha/beta fold hydrolase [Xenophilus sp. Marseille-Q4582]|uniref:alpha/beta fold hydrolase n=1 Tax=Xenophilus sp. Marseille-Q4582 TaxID=2866600 RepID=UPI001CE3FA71|nr:alpha/beta fold hydrolase [Xenophilus sp. Marseille-Q4582]